MILGIDEVGRGPWAGPLVIGAVVLGDAKIEGLTDSKKLSKKRREVLDEAIREKALGWALGWVHADELDRVGLAEALRLATRRAVEQITVPYHEIIIDGTINFLAGTSKAPSTSCLKKADLLIPSVSAASIIAKVARDTYMAEQDAVYPGYAFVSHAGYGTAAHRKAIAAHGVTPLHRLSFAPLARYRPAQEAQAHSQPAPRTTKQRGDQAETVVAEYLQAKGHTVVARNWRTKFCEIDIISTKAGVVYFTEVKYRKNAAHGDGLAAITPQKQQQMKFAAELYLASKKDYSGAQLIAASVSGGPPKLDHVLLVD